MVIRRAEKRDIPALCKLEQECFSLPWSEKSFDDFFSLNFTFALAAFDNIDGEEKLIGYAGMYISGNDGDITNIAVSSQYRRRGIGHALIEGLKAVSDINNLYLEVRESNLAAISLYESQGFKKDGVRKNFYHAPRENAILMSCKKS